MTTATAASPVTPSKPWKLDFILLAAIWGASFMFMRIGAVELGTFATAGLRVSVAAALLLPLLLARGQGPILLQHWKMVLVVGVFNSAIPFACFSFAPCSCPCLSRETSSLSNL